MEPFQLLLDAPVFGPVAVGGGIFVAVGGTAVVMSGRLPRGSFGGGGWFSSRRGGSIPAAGKEEKKDLHKNLMWKVSRRRSAGRPPMRRVRSERRSWG